MDLRPKRPRISSLFLLTLETTAIYSPKVHLKSAETAKLSDKHAEGAFLCPQNFSAPRLTLTVLCRMREKSAAAEIARLVLSRCVSRGGKNRGRGKNEGG